MDAFASSRVAPQVVSCPSNVGTGFIFGKSLLLEDLATVAEQVAYGGLAPQVEGGTAKAVTDEV